MTNPTGRPAVQSHEVEVSRVAMALVLAVTAVHSAAAQSSDLPPVFMGSVQLIPLPDGDGAWVLQVISRGGLTGRGAGDVVVISDGRVRRLSGGTESMRPEALGSLRERIERTTPAAWTLGSRLGRCNDCVSTLVVLTVRERGGVVHTYSSFWDATTLAGIPEDVRQIHQYAVSISGQ
jgi:hypothetical protein